MRLPEEKRDKFKEPLGKLFEGPEEAFDYLNSLDYEKIITVGDVVSARFLRNGWKPDMIIADYKSERSPTETEYKEIIEDYSVPSIEVKNPAGYITEDLRDSIESAETPVKIIVEGEEDLATLPATLTAPLGSIVVYGQPNEGIVIIEVTEKKREEFRNFLDLFED